MDLLLFVLMLTISSGSLLILFYLVRSIVLQKATKDLLQKCNDLEEIYRKVTNRINQLKKELGDYEIAEPSEIIGEALKGGGIAQILGSLNIDDTMLREIGVPGWALPVVKGFIERMKAKQASGGESETQSIRGFQ